MLCQPAFRRRQVLEPHASSLLNLRAAPCDTAKELRVALQLVLDQSSSDWNPMRTPAGRPWRVITISRASARRRYRERSSFTFASATRLAWGPLRLEPRVGF